MITESEILTRQFRKLRIYFHNVNRYICISPKIVPGKGIAAAADGQRSTCVRTKMFCEAVKSRVVRIQFVEIVEEDRRLRE